jgi:hypothetical protein
MVSSTAGQYGLLVPNPFVKKVLLFSIPSSKTSPHEAEVALY